MCKACAQLSSILLLSLCILYLLSSSSAPGQAPERPAADEFPPTPVPTAASEPQPAADSSLRTSHRLRGHAPRRRRPSLPPCAALHQWDDTHFSHDQDWVPLADGRRVQPDTLWHWDGSHLRNKATGGHLNFRPGGFVRGHGNAMPRKPAAAAVTTRLEREVVPFDRFELDGPACAPAQSVTLCFTQGRRYVHVLQDGSLSAQLVDCAGDAACTFAWEPQPRLGGGWVVLRSRLTGRLLRMVDDTHVPFTSWDGIFAPRARGKSAARLALERQRAAAAAAAAGAGAAAGGCPLLPTARPPAGWAYNATRHAALIAAALAPWYAGNLTASGVDMAFWRDMFPYANRAELPSLHLSLKGGALFYKWQRDADSGSGGGGGGGGGAGGSDGAPPPGSADAQLLAMLAQVAHVVALPDVEAVAHTTPKPKVPAQNPELVLSPVADAAHNDVPVPSPWLWAGLAASAEAASLCGPLAARAPRLLVLGECEAPPEGRRGPLWPFYAAHRALALAARHPRLLRVALRHACTRGGGGGSDGGESGGGAASAARQLPVEAAWDRRAAREVRALTDAAAARGVALGEAAAARAAEEACGHRWLLLLDGAGPPRELAARMRQGFTIFRQASPYSEYFYAQLEPWQHYVPVAANLDDLPRRVRWARANPEAAAAIARRAQEFATSLHVFDVACFWWQLLTAMAPLQNFEPRTQSALGFAPAQRS